MSSVWCRDLFKFNKLRWEMIVRYVDIDGTVNRQFWNFVSQYENNNSSHLLMYMMRQFKCNLPTFIKYINWLIQRYIKTLFIEYTLFKYNILLKFKVKMNKTNSNSIECPYNQLSSYAIINSIYYSATYTNAFLISEATPMT